MRAQGAGLGLLLLALAACGPASEPGSGSGSPASGLNPADARSGATFLTPETRAMQDDDFANPGLLWVDRGAALFAEGEASCASCHGADGAELKGAATSHPRVDPATGRVVNLEGRINACRTARQNRPALAYESDDLLALTTYVASLSRGMPMAVKTDGAAQAPYEAGRELFFTRRGQLNLSCSQCHDQNWGKQLRGDTISQGHPTAFPGTRLEWQSVGSLHRRLSDCAAGVRSVAPLAGSDEHLALELYLAARANGLPVESPGVRR